MTGDSDNKGSHPGSQLKSAMLTQHHHLMLIEHRVVLQVLAEQDVTHFLDKIGRLGFY